MRPLKRIIVEIWQERSHIAFIRVRKIDEDEHTAMFFPAMVSINNY